MSKKFTAQRRNAFLKALAQTGNQTIAAERAKVSRSWVQLHRSGDPAFRAAVEAAVVAAKARLEGAASRAPAGLGKGVPDYHDGAELVVRGTNGRRTQIARSRIKQWSPRVEARFLRALGQTCNVKAACAEVGMTPASAYAHRDRWPGFGDRWAMALEHGYIQIEMALLQSAANFLCPDEIELPDGITGMSVDRAIYLLHMHKHQVRMLGGRPGKYKRYHDAVEGRKVRASILRKIELIERHRAMQPAIEAAGEPGPRDWASFRPEDADG
jgi:hypothetical protein